MMIAFSRRRTQAAAAIGILLLASTGWSTYAFGQTTDETPLQRELAKVDLGVSAAGIFSKNTSGVNYLGQSVNERPSNTVGVLVNLRYTHSPPLGAELNYLYSRRTELYTLSASPSILGVQTNATEYSAGYLVHTRNQYFGVQPYASAGLGVLSFKPTPGGGQGLPKEPVAVYYYSVGVENNVFDSHFGYRIGLRQTFNLAPDFLQNYLSTGKSTFTVQPTVGFYARF